MQNSTGDCIAPGNSLSGLVAPLLRICGVCPKSFRGEQIQKQRWKNLTCTNMLTIILSICISLGQTTWFIVSDDTRLSGIFWNVFASFLCWFTTSSILYFLLYQRELLSVLKKLETFLKKDISVHRRSVGKSMFIGFYLGIILVGVCRFFAMPQMGMILSGKITVRIFLAAGYVVVKYCFLLLLRGILKFSFCIVCAIFVRCLDQVFGKMNKQQRNVSVVELREILHRCKDLHLVLKEFSQWYSRLLFVWYIESTLEIVFGIPASLLQSTVTSRMDMKFVYFSIFCYNITVVLTVTLYGSSVQKRFQTLQTHLLKNVSALESGDVFLEKMSIVESISKFSMEIDVWGFFVIDNKLLISVLLNTIGMVVILTQIKL